jgi:hypothetical protein
VCVGQFDGDMSGDEGAYERQADGPAASTALSRPGSEVNRLLDRAESLKRTVQATRDHIVGTLGEPLFHELYSFLKQHADVDEADEEVRCRKARKSSKELMAERMECSLIR